MKSFSKFYFKTFEFNKLNMHAKFHYSFDNEVFFEEIIDFSSNLFGIRKEINLEILDNILFHLHIALGISYYKSYPTEELIVESGKLDKFQKDFWKKFYINGLGEFLYTNKISPNGLFNFINPPLTHPCQGGGQKGNNKQYVKKDFEISNKALVPVGGGKDSIVSIELFKKAGFDFDLFVFGKEDELKKYTAKISGKKILLVKRKISDSLFELNNKGYYNGHIPITGLIAFVMEVSAYLYNYKYLVLSNEKSANFGNTDWNGININHQYSKSLEFEKDFANYVEKYISSDVKYFSLLRGMYEITIAELFSKYAQKYFSNFSSCNNNFKINPPLTPPYQGGEQEESQKGKYWCNNCPKCAFVFSILTPYLSEDEIKNIFGENLYERKDLEILFRELLGISGIKPFECVGEAEEVIYSMFKSLDNYDNNNLPFILEIFKNEVLIKFNKVDFKKIEKKLVTITSDDIIPKEIKELIFKTI